MIPSALLELIHKYNENGIFIHDCSNVYWFNGKRLEWWLTCFGIEQVKTFNKHVYIYYHRNKIRIYKNCKICALLIQPFEKNYKKIFHGHYSMILEYQYNYLVFDGFQPSNYTHKDRSLTPFFFNNRFYIFDNESRSEYYDIFENKWNAIALENYLGYFLKYKGVYFFNNLFYIITSDYFICIYDPMTDIWKERTTFQKFLR